MSCIILESTKKHQKCLKGMWFFLLERACFIAWKKNSFPAKKHHRMAGWDDPPKLSLSSPVRRLQYLDEVHWPTARLRFLGRLGRFLVANSKEKGMSFFSIRLGNFGWNRDVVLRSIHTQTWKTRSLLWFFFGVFSCEISKHKKESKSLKVSSPFWAERWFTLVWNYCWWKKSQTTSWDV